MVVIRRSDLTNNAISLGIWEGLCEAAGIEPENNDEQEITINLIEGEE